MMSTHTPAVADADEELPESIQRIGQAMQMPNEYPGQIYSFNWCLNGDGVTPLRRRAFRITKALDLRVASLDPPHTMPLEVTPSPASDIPEAGADEDYDGNVKTEGGLSFDQFDAYSQKTRDNLSLSETLYCPEGHVPGTRTGVRVITNSASLAPQILAYLERAPKKEPAESLPITVYALEGGYHEQTEANVAGYAIEEIEVKIDHDAGDDGDDWHINSEHQTSVLEARSVASIVVSNKEGTPSINTIVAGIEASQKALAEDELKRKKEKEAQEQAD